MWMPCADAEAAAEVVRTIVSVVNHCHTMNVIHRDLKPENFLLSSKGRDAVLKATDFGLSRFFKVRVCTCFGGSIGISSNEL